MREILLIAALLVGPTIQRDPSMPLRVGAFNGYELTRQAAQLRTLIPEDSGPVFILGNALILHLAERPGYWRQNHQWWVAFTAKDHPEYRRMGLWGPRDMRAWLTESRYAVLDDHALRYFRGRPPYAFVMAEMTRLLERDYVVVGRIGTWTIYTKGRPT